jgi:predicted anti-sigma-YlaC factor YlaD
MIQQPNPNAPHLTENDILQAVIDDTDLSDGQKVHLAQCAPCRSLKNQLEQELARLAQLAKRYSPTPQRHITVVERQDRSPFFNWRFAFSAAAIVAVILVVLGISLIRSQQHRSIGNLAQNMVEAEKLMTEVNALVESALPPVYLDIIGETDLSTDEDFIDFLIPNTASVPRTSAWAEKGSVS